MDVWIRALNELKNPATTLLDVFERIWRLLSLEQSFLTATLADIDDQIKNNAIYPDRIVAQLKEVVKQIDKLRLFFKHIGAQTVAATTPPVSTTVSINLRATTAAVGLTTAGIACLGFFFTAGITGLASMGAILAGSLYRERRLAACWARDTALWGMFSDLLFQNAVSIAEAFQKCGITCSSRQPPPRLDDPKLASFLANIRLGPSTRIDPSSSIEKTLEYLHSGVSTPKSPLTPLPSITIPTVVTASDSPTIPILSTTDSNSPASPQPSGSTMVQTQGIDEKSAEPPTMPTLETSPAKVASTPWFSLSSPHFPSTSTPSPHNPVQSSYIPSIIHSNIGQALTDYEFSLREIRGKAHELRDMFEQIKSSLSPHVPWITLTEFGAVWRSSPVPGSGGSAGFVQKGTLYGRHVAYKALIHPEDSFYQRSVDMEVKTLSKLRGVEGVSQLVCVVGDENPKRIHGLVLEWIEGVTLRQYLKLNPSLSTIERLQLALAAARILDRLHNMSSPPFLSAPTVSITPSPSPFNSPARSPTVSPRTSPPLSPLSQSLRVSGPRGSVIHRDFKPNNVMVQPTFNNQKSVAGWKCVLIDFGFSREVDEKANQLHSKFPYVGTTAYLSPEIIEHSPQVTTAVDVYAFGISLPEILTGSVWSLSESEKMTPSATVLGRFPDIAPRALGTRLRQLVQRCIEVEPSRRPKIHDVVLGLQAILAINWATFDTSPSSADTVQADQSVQVKVEVVKTITEDQLLKIPVLPVECGRESFTICSRDDRDDFPVGTKVALHHPAADYGVVLPDVTVHQNTLDVKVDTPFSPKYKHHIGKVLKGTRADIVAQVFVLNSDGTAIGRCRVGLVTQWIGENCQVLRFFVPNGEDGEDEDDDNERKDTTVKLKEFGKSRFWVTLPLDWEKVIKD